VRKKGIFCHFWTLFFTCDCEYNDLHYMSLQCTSAVLVLFYFSSRRSNLFLSRFYIYLRQLANTLYATAATWT